MIVVHLKNEAQLILYSNSHLHDLILKNDFHNNNNVFELNNSLHKNKNVRISKCLHNVFFNYSTIYFTCLLLCNLTKHCYSLTDQIRYGSYMAVPVPADCHWRLDGGEVLFDQTLHRRTFCTGVWSYCWRRLLLPSGRDWTRQTHQASDLGHGRPREIQVHLVVFDDIYM